MTHPSIASIDRAIDMIVSAWPRGLLEWRDRFESGGRTPDSPYTDLARLAEATVSMVQAEPTADLAGLFAATEDALAGAAPDVRKLLVVGFLEDIQNISLNRGVALETYRQWLGPQTRLAWKAIADVWNARLSPDDFNRGVSTGKWDTASRGD